MGLGSIAILPDWPVVARMPDARMPERFRASRRRSSDLVPPVMRASSGSRGMVKRLAERGAGWRMGIGRRQTMEPTGLRDWTESADWRESIPRCGERERGRAIELGMANIISSAWLGAWSFNLCVMALAEAALHGAARRDHFH